MVVDVEYVLVDHHHTPAASEESAVGCYCASCALISAMKCKAHFWRDSPKPKLPDGDNGGEEIRSGGKPEGGGNRSGEIL